MDDIKIGDKSDFFPAITRASRMLMGNDDEQPGHLVYVSDGRLILRNFIFKSCYSSNVSHVVESYNQHIKLGASSRWPFGLNSA